MLSVLATLGALTPLPKLHAAQPPDAERLAPGKAAGTYHLAYRGRVSFSRDPAFPVLVTLSAGGKVLAQKEVADGRAFKIEADVPPGTCEVHSEPSADAARRKYWDAYGVVLTVSGSGLVTQRAGSDQITHKLKMKLLGPDRLAVVREKRPVLRWEAVPGAKYYVVGWFEQMPRGRRVVKTVQPLRTTEAKYQFEEDVVPARVYEWFVFACDGRDEEGFAYYSSGYFLTPGADPKDVAAPDDSRAAPAAPTR